jgi:hypothetical protein
VTGRSAAVNESDWPGNRDGDHLVGRGLSRSPAAGHGGGGRVKLARTESCEPTVTGPPGASGVTGCLGAARATVMDWHAGPGCPSRPGTRRFESADSEVTL